ncbi:anti-sigma factor [Streptomyces sp. NPDC050703]|uniref:anti-sigma factor n=1 Tax=Streptomyces sp. NPDC050703 TaxID=3157218 RepID=UPI0034258F3B
MNGAADLHTLTGAYATHALEDEEREAFERHLSACESCAQEVRELRATTARLGLAASVVPRPAMKDEVLHRIATVRQVLPAERGPDGSPPKQRPRRLAQWALAACVAAAAALGGTAVWQYGQTQAARDQARQAEQQSQELAALLAAPDAKTRAAELSGGAGGAVVVAESRDRAAFVATGMAKPPAGKVYQLWFSDDGVMRPAGLMDPGRSTQTVLMEGPLDGAAGMGITVEPAGGSARPTTSPVAVVDFPA